LQKNQKINPIQRKNTLNNHTYEVARLIELEPDCVFSACET